jgi:RNA polymerase-binding transcription factor DksA
MKEIFPAAASCMPEEPCWHFTCTKRASSFSHSDELEGDMAARKDPERRFDRAWLSKRKAALEWERSCLQAEIDREAELLQVPGTSTPLERGDHSEEEREDDGAIETLEAFQSRLAVVEAAQMKIRLGTYGSCSACFRPIPLRRLELHPSAVRCGGCQRQKDLERSKTPPHRRPRPVVFRFPKTIRN